MLRPNKDVQWRVIANKIRAQIANGELSPGRKLDTEHELAKEHGVNRHTVRRALAELKEKQIIEVIQGRGSFIRFIPLEYRVTNSIWLDELVQFERPIVDSLQHGCRMEAAPNDVAKALSINAGADVVAIDKIGYDQKTPVALSSHFIAIQCSCRREDFIDAIDGGASIKDALAECGMQRTSRRYLDIAARSATKQERDQLKLNRNEPLLVTEAVFLNEAEAPIEFNLARFASDRIRFKLDAI